MRASPPSLLFSSHLIPLKWHPLFRRILLFSAVVFYAHDELAVVLVAVALVGGGGGEGGLDHDGRGGHGGRRRRRARGQARPDQIFVCNVNTINCMTITHDAM